jgi:hypothetical protein
MNSISEWLEDPTEPSTNVRSTSQEGYIKTKSAFLDKPKPAGKVLVFGNDNLTKRIVEMVVKERQRDVYLSTKCVTINANYHPYFSNTMQRNMRFVI